MPCGFVVGELVACRFGWLGRRPHADKSVGEKVGLSHGIEFHLVSRCLGPSAFAGAGSCRAVRRVAQGWRVARDARIVDALVCSVDGGSMTKRSGGRVVKRWGCVNPDDGRRWGWRCPRLGERGHGRWYFAVALAAGRDGGRRRVQRGGFAS